MKRLRSRFVGRNLVSVFVAVVVLSLWLSVSVDAGVLLSDTFSSGTTINPSTWDIITLYGPSGQFTQNSGLIYTGSATDFAAADSDWTSLRSNTFSGGIQGTIQFSNFTSSSTYGSTYTGLRSLFAFGMGPTNDELSITIWNGLIRAGLFDIVNTGNNPSSTPVPGVTPVSVSFPTTPVNMTPTSGQFQFIYNGSTVSAYYNLDEGGGWQPLGTFTPGWSGPQSIFIAGRDWGNGTTSFTVNNVTVSSVPLPSALLLFGPGLAGLAAIRRRFRK